LAVALGFAAGVRFSGEAAGSAVAPAGAAAAFGFVSAGAGEALAVASGFVAGISSSGEAATPAGAAAAFGFADAGGGEALDVSLGFVAGVSSSAEAAGSVVAVVIPVSFGDAADSGGHTIQHSAPAGDDSNVGPTIDTSTVSRRNFGFMIHPSSISYACSPVSELLRALGSSVR
jgi:hypothetical protein